MNRNFRSALVLLSLASACGGSETVTRDFPASRECSVTVAAEQLKRDANAVMRDGIELCSPATQQEDSSVELVRIEADEEGVFERLVFLSRQMHPQSPAPLRR